MAEWPRTIRYLLEGIVSPVFQFETREETEDLERFKALVLATMARHIAERRAEDIAFGPVLEGTHSFNALDEQGHPYVTKTFIVQQLNIPFPPWVQQRMDELDQRYR